MRNKILIIGLGRLGTSIADRASLRGQNVIVIDSNKERLEQLGDAFSGFKVQGDATDMHVLEEDCYIDTCNEVVITTDDDNTNLFLAHVCADIYEVPHVYVRFDSPELLTLVSAHHNIRAIYPFELSLQRFIMMEGEEEE